MSRQLRFFLLPSDVERLLEDLRPYAPLKLMARETSGRAPQELDFPYSEFVRDQDGIRVVRVNCVLGMPGDARIVMRYSPRQQQWGVADESEVIEFSGCDYDGETLRIGRFYFQTDQLIGDAIWKKRTEFLKWGDRVFRRTKQLLEYSKALDAYLGKDAAAWQKAGGEFRHI